jgi:hypothetical protein
MNPAQSNNYYWNGYSSGDRIALLPVLEQNITRFGYVVNVQPFSDLSLVLTLEVSATNLQPLQETLAEVLQLDEEPMLPAEPAAACVVFLHVNFSRG